MVQAKKASSIRQQWKESGAPLCTHESTEKEYELGSQTGDIMCMDCGETFYGKDALETARAKARRPGEGSD